MTTQSVHVTKSSLCGFTAAPVVQTQHILVAAMFTCRSELLPAYVKLLRDTEAEVRVAAAGKVSAISKMLAPDRVIGSIIPCVKDLAADSSQHVRSALASVVMEVAPVLGKSATIEHLLPVFLSLLKDDFPDVRLNIISKLDQVNQVRMMQLRCIRPSRCKPLCTCRCNVCGVVHAARCCAVGSKCLLFSADSHPSFAHMQAISRVPACHIFILQFSTKMSPPN